MAVRACKREPTRVYPGEALFYLSDNSGCSIEDENLAIASVCSGCGVSNSSCVYDDALSSNRKLNPLP